MNSAFSWALWRSASRIQSKTSFEKCKFPKNPLKLALKGLLAHVGTATVALVEGAVVVDVPLLLDFGSDGAAAAGTLEEPGVGKAVAAGASIVPLGDDCLNPVKELLVHDGRMLALVVLAVPEEITGVEGILQRLRNRSASDPVPGTAPLVPRGRRGPKACGSNTHRSRRA